MRRDSVYEIARRCRSSELRKQVNSTALSEEEKERYDAIRDRKEEESPKERARRHERREKRRRRRKETDEEEKKNDDEEKEKNRDETKERSCEEGKTKTPRTEVAVQGRSATNSP